MSACESAAQAATQCQLTGGSCTSEYSAYATCYCNADNIPSGCGSCSSQCNTMATCAMSNPTNQNACAGDVSAWENCCTGGSGTTGDNGGTTGDNGGTTGG